MSKCSELRRKHHCLLQRAAREAGVIGQQPAAARLIETRIYGLVLTLPAATDEIYLAIWCWMVPALTGYFGDPEVVAGGEIDDEDQTPFLHCPQRLAVLPDDSVLVADWGEGRITRWRDGRGSIYAERASDGEGFTYALCYDPSSGSVFASTDSGVERLSDPDCFDQGELQRTTVLGRDAHLADHCGICVDASGNLFVADLMNNRVVQSVGPGAVEDVRLFSDQLHSSVRLAMPSDVATSAGNTLLICDQGSGRVLRRWPNGQTKVLISDRWRPYAICEVSGILCVAEFGADCVTFFDPVSGRVVQPALAIQRPTGLAVDSHLNLYVTERDKHRVLRFRPSFG
eukprot:TRINITY_DN33046_c0_g1_i1.p1 TRINITY_DN33046_c0_g1~~TRINITY_DN33046_c0_g1_i1.p1  ORF type:complete len:343 (+),score=40.26 TRINITY_DN33046_c0_g1_i1:273-1301(+)